VPHCIICRKCEAQQSGCSPVGAKCELTPAAPLMLPTQRHTGRMSRLTAATNPRLCDSRNTWHTHSPLLHTCSIAAPSRLASKPVKHPGELVHLTSCLSFLPPLCRGGHRYRCPADQVPVVASCHTKSWRHCSTQCAVRGWGEYDDGGGWLTAQPVTLNRGATIMAPPAGGRHRRAKQ
jgi:hypothetical protein